MFDPSREAVVLHVSQVLLHLDHSPVVEEIDQLIEMMSNGGVGFTGTNSIGVYPTGLRLNKADIAQQRRAHTASFSFTG